VAGIGSSVGWTRRGPARRRAPWPALPSEPGEAFERAHRPRTRCHRRRTVRVRSGRRPRYRHRGRRAGRADRCPHGAREHHPPDAVGAGRVVARGSLFEDAGLDLLVGGGAEGLAMSRVISPAASASKTTGASVARRKRPSTKRTVSPKRRATSSMEAPLSTSDAKACASSAGFMARRWKFSARLVSTALRHSRAPGR
jgi:hypothetical protein